MLNETAKGERENTLELSGNRTDLWWILELKEVQKGLLCSPWITYFTHGYDFVWSWQESLLCRRSLLRTPHGFAVIAP